MSDIVISGTGLFTPPHVITNTELVQAYNDYADVFNNESREEIESGEKGILCSFGAGYSIGSFILEKM